MQQNKFINHFRNLSALVLLTGGIECYATTNTALDIPVRTTVGSIIKESTANLSSLSEEERRTLTDLALSGILTSEDFRIMRDEMPSLQTLDLSQTNNAEIPVFALSGHGKLQQIILPTSCSKIDEGAFSGCSELKEINLEGIQSIGTMAFCNTALTQVKLSSKVTFLGDFAFEGCKKLTNIEVEEQNNHFTSVDGVLFNKELTTLIKYPEAHTGALTLPASVTRIEDFACSGSLALSGVPLFTEKIQYIGKYGFDNCRGMKGNLNLPANGSVIGDHAFWGCSNISSSLNIPENTSTGKHSFAHMIGLETITLPNSMDNLEDGLFLECSNVKSVTTSRTVPATVGTFTFYGMDFGNVALNIPEQSETAYQNAEGWSDFYKEPVEETIIRYTTSGPHYIQYVGQGINANKYLSHNMEYGKVAKMSDIDEATPWDLNFFKGWGSSETAFNGGMITDMKYTLPSDDSMYGMMIFSGICYTEEKSKYIINNNNNRAFAFWLDKETGLVAIQTNGKYLNASSSKAEIAPVNYSGAPRPQDFVFRLISKDMAQTYQPNFKPIETLEEIKEDKLYILRNCLNEADRGDRSGYLTMESNIINVTQGQEKLNGKNVFHIHKSAEGTYSFANNKLYIPNTGNIGTSIKPTATEAFFRILPVEGNKGVFNIQSVANNNYLNANGASGSKPGYSVFWGDAKKANPYHIYEVTETENTPTKEVTYRYLDANTNILLQETKHQLRTETYPVLGEIQYDQPVGFELVSIDQEAIGETTKLQPVGENKQTYDIKVWNKVHIGNSQYATLYAAYPLIIPKGMKAYSGKVDSENERLILQEIHEMIPAETGVLLQANEGDYVFDVTEETVTAISGNDLKGTLGNIIRPTEGTIYTLQQIDNVIGFYKYLDANMKPCHAYLQLPESGINSIRLYFGETTKINTPESEIIEEIYDLNGNRIKEITKSGIYILNGKKVMVIK